MSHEFHLCGYIAHWGWHYGPRGYEVFGDLTNGYIVIPVMPYGH